MEKRVKTCKFNGVIYDIDIDPIYGATQDPSPIGYRPTLRVVNGLPFGNRRGAKIGFETVVHEALHAANFNSHEETVERVAREVTNLLWRLGYRRTK